MHYLIGVSAKDKIVLIFEAVKDNLKLDIGNVLHFINNYKIIYLPDVFQIAVRKNVRIIKAVFLEKDEIFLKKCIISRTFL